MGECPVVLITGASSGIGEATARFFASKSFRLILTARRKDRLEKLADEINSMGGQALPVVADIVCYDEIQEVVDAGLRKFQHVDVLFNNAGFGRFNWLENFNVEEDIEAQIRTNLLGVINLTKLVLPHMIERKKGHIINMVSMAGFIATPTYTIYAASKFAVRGFTEALRREVGVWGIRVSGIYPGSVATEFETHAGDQRKTRIRTPSFLRLNAEDIAKVVYRVVQRPRRSVILPKWMVLFIWLNNFFPGFMDYSIKRFFVNRERG